jgi:branched-chain amino acid transport system substrate-binding protein
VTQFAGDAAGVYPRLEDAVARALKKAQPGTEQFREALREELEHAHELVVPNGVVNTSAKDHVGLDQRASVMGAIRGGKFVFISE